MTRRPHPLRPFVAGDIMALRDLFAASIEELCQEDYDEDQRAAWAGEAGDAAEFARRLTMATTLVVMAGGEHAGFASLKDNSVIDLLYVHPYHAGEGIGTALADALEKLAASRGADAVTVDASETSVMFFEGRGYEPQRRNSVPREDVWLTTTTMKKLLKAPAGKALS